MPHPSPASRILFLDDDPCRAEAFASMHPQMVWVKTVEDCLGKLENAGTRSTWTTTWEAKSSSTGGAVTRDGGGPLARR